MRDFKGIFPGIFTMGSMFCGFLAIISCVRGTDPSEPAWLILLAAFLDFLDGWVARASKSASRFGVELDSLSDLVSFAIAPAVMLYTYILVSYGRWAWILGFIFVMAAVFRLARFNLQADLEKKKSFIGLPVPVAAVAISSYMIFSLHIWNEIRFQELAVTMIVGFAVLMVSTIEYESNPQFSIRNKAGIFRLLFLLASMVAIIYKPRYALFPVSMLYILSGIVREGVLLVKQAPKSSKKGISGHLRKNKAKNKKNAHKLKESNDDGKSLHFPEAGGGRSSGTDD